jgi:hypothetical protein
MPAVVPCAAAKLVGGFDVIERVHKLPVAPGGYSGLVNPVTIVSGRVVPSAQPHTSR